MRHLEYMRSMAEKVMKKEEENQIKYYQAKIKATW